LTATTPTNSAVRLETGAVEFQLSNRVQNVSGAAQPNPYMKIFGKAQVDINLSLGQLLKNVIFEEAEPEFQQYAFFKTRIGKIILISLQKMVCLFDCCSNCMLYRKICGKVVMVVVLMTVLTTMVRMVTLVFICQFTTHVWKKLFLFSLLFQSFSIVLFNN
jgi:hypothetical protein